MTDLAARLPNVKALLEQEADRALALLEEIDRMLDAPAAVSETPRSTEQS